MTFSVKMIGKQIGAALVVVILAGGVWYLWLRDAHSSAPVSSQLSDEVIRDPFARVIVPDVADTTTHDLFVGNVSSTKALYVESPEDTRTWIAIGNLYHQFKQPQEAIIAYKKAAELEPNSLLAYRNIAEVYARDVGDYEQAATYYRLAITRSVSDPTLYLSYGMLLDTNLHQPEKAEKVYLEALEKTRYDRDVLLSLVELYKRMGNTTKYEEYGKILLNRYSDDSLIQQKYKAIK